MKLEPHSHSKLIPISILLWSALIFLSFYLNIHNFEEHSIRLATNQASDYWNKDSAFRAWATEHGGLYVRPDERTPPNPLLAHLPHRDVETKDGVQLTLMNPAYMMRQMTEEFEELYGVKGKITGQILLDPEGNRNKPDPWELESLKAFDRGKSEIVQVTQINNESYLRLMRPMIITEGCVLCHGHLGFRVGDIRGGVSVSVPLAPYELANKSSRNQAIISHIALWLLGLLVIGYINRIKSIQAQKDRRSRELLHRSQRMDALGKLSGGIAHDFNNILGVITGYAELLEKSLSEQPKLAKYAQQIYHSGDRGAKLTKKLLSFSKTISVEAEVLSINSLMLDQQNMLEKTLTARISLLLELSDDLWPILVERGDLEDAIVNMCINAMHAIENGGEITIRTANEHFDKSDGLRMNLPEGDYVLLSISDTGVGMDQATQNKIFEPFFSTKGEKGTGLGLSQVYGFVERSGGLIKVYSELGHGTQFKLYFPRHYGGMDAKLTKGGDDTAQALGGDETILLVDDEVALLEMTSEILNQQGYHTLTANNGEQALKLLEAESIDLMLSDVIMPGMDGYQLATIVQQKYPKVKIQLASGFNDKRYVGVADETLHKNQLVKPLLSQTLLRRIRELLDS